MRYLSLVTIFLTIGIIVHCQDEQQLPAKWSRKLELDNETFNGNGKMPFKKILVFDYRYDTSKLGYFGKATKIVFDPSMNSFTALLNNYFKQQLDPSSEKTMIIILKTFWLGVNGCIANLEVFSNISDQYKALLKIDYEFDTYALKKKYLVKSVLLPFDSLFRKIQSLDIENLLSQKRNFTWDNIHNNYSSRFDIPILKSTEQKRGVFLTFEDFKQRKVTYPDFQIKKGKLTDELYVNDNLLTSFWGFSDGTDYFIKLGYNFFKLVRQNNTFDLMGAENLTREAGYVGSYPNNSTVPIGTQTYPSPNVPYIVTKLELKALQLDMDIGDVY